jgi:glycosyltransferase involved in cell wall biosynthesis
VIHIHDWHGYSAADQVRHLLGTPVVATVHALHAAFVPRFGAGSETGKVIELERQCCQGADRIIAVSHSLLRETVTAYGIPESRIETIYNGFDLRSFTESQSARGQHETEKSQLLKPGERAIVYAGRLAPQKGLSSLLLSAIQVLKREPNVRYLIAGDAARNGYTDILFSLVNNHPLLRERVTFLGMVPRERLSMIYGLASVVVVPSLYEPFGYAATEPMALGKAVIATDTGGLSEIIVHEQSGLLVPLKWFGEEKAWNLDIQKFSEAQCRLLRDPRLAAKLGQAAQRRIATEFSLEKMINSTLQCYEKTMNGAGYLEKAG